LKVGKYSGLEDLRNILGKDKTDPFVGLLFTEFGGKSF
jgi:hypothetical protein